MEASVGAELRTSMGNADRGIIDVTHLGSLNITTAPAATSDNFTALQIEGGLCNCNVTECQVLNTAPASLQHPLGGGQYTDPWCLLSGFKLALLYFAFSVWTLSVEPFGISHQ